MILQEFKKRIDLFFALVISRTGSLPNVNKVAVAARDFIEGRYGQIQAQLEMLFEQGRFDEGVNLLVALLKQGLKGLKIPYTGPLAWLWNLFGSQAIDPIIDQLGNWLKANRELFKGTIGSSL